MKKMFIAMLITGIIPFASDAQTNKAKSCTPVKKTTATVAKATGNGKSPYAENFKVCKVYCGYTICGEDPSVYNTAPKTCGRNMSDDNVAGGYYFYHAPTEREQYNANEEKMAQSKLAPQSQSYPFDPKAPKRSR